MQFIGLSFNYYIEPNHLTVYIHWSLLPPVTKPHSALDSPIFIFSITDHI